jgi:putative SOS response-associated peptidase YedK
LPEPPEGMDAAPPSRHHAEMGNSAGNSASGSKSQPQATWRITLEDGGPFAFAGLWERWEKAPDGVPVESCTIITTAANALVPSSMTACR